MANQTDRATIDLVINGQQSQTSLKDITTAAVNARKALSQMAETDPGYKKQKAELEALMRAQQQRIVRINEEKTAWERFKAGTGQVMAGVLGGDLISTGIGLIGDGLRAAKQEFIAFDAASKELSAVTGATGKDLEYLNQQARQTGPTFGKSASDMLEAYKLMASAKPELLAQKELLVQTTKAAITLSQAGKINLAEATKVTAESLNQFGEGADQANRFINVIAAGAKEGSAEINDMGIALKNSGTVAAAQGVSFEQTNALLQSMSTIALKGGEAGTQLRNVLLTLGSGANDTNPKVVGLETALENLAKKNLSTAEMTKLFGKENITAAQHVISHRKEIATLTEKVTGTSEAFSQAAKNNDSYEQKTARLNAIMAKLALTIGSRLVPVLTDLLGYVGKAASWIDEKLTPASERATQAFDDQRTKVQDLSKNFLPLLDRHDDLIKKAKDLGGVTKLSSTEQAELKKIVGQVAETVPGAVTQFDGYNKALGVSTGKAREFVKEQQAMLKVLNQKAIEEHTNALAKEEAQLAENKKYEKRATSGSFWKSGTIQMSKEDDDAYKIEIAKLEETVKGRHALIKRLSGDYLNQQPVKPATPAPATGTGTDTGTGGGDNEETKEEKKARLARDKAQRKRSQLDEQYNRLIEQSRARTAQAEGESFEKEQIQFGDHYAQLYKLAGTNKERMTEITTLMYKELSALTQKEEERQKKAAEKKAEEDQKKNKEKFEAEMEALALQYEQERAVYEPLEDELAKSDEDRKLFALQREEKFLIAQQLLAKKNAQSELDIQAQLTDNHVAQAKLRREATEKSNEALKQSSWQTMAAYASSLEQGATALKEFLHKGTVAYKAVVVAQKAGAIAQVVINTQKEISGYWADPQLTALGPIAGPALKTAMSVAAGARAAASIATISKQGAAELAEKDDGGFTGIQDLYGSPSGYYDRPTRVNAGRRSYIVGEKRKEWIMGGEMLANPVMANLAGALQAVQMSGSYRNMSFGSLSGGGDSGAGSGMDMAVLVSELQALRQEVKTQSQRPINYNYFKVRETEQRVAEINTATTL